MDRRALATLLLAVLAATAGCSLLGGGSTPGPTPDGTASPTPTATTTDGPPPADLTPATGPSNTPGSSGTPAADYPAGYGPGGVTDWRAATRAHVDGMVGHDSFIVRYNGTVLRAHETAAITIEQAAELPDDEAYVVTNITGHGITTLYFANDTRYRRFVPEDGNETEYSSSDVSYRMANFAGGSLVRPLVQNVSYDSVERVETDSGTYLRLYGERLRNPASLFGAEVEGVRDFQAAIVVDEDGVVRRISYRATVRHQGSYHRLSADVKVVGIDATTVEPPAWRDRAENASS